MSMLSLYQSYKKDNDTDNSQIRTESENIIYYTHAVYILPITISNVAIIFIYFNVRLLRTPANCTIAFLAVADLLIGIIVIPITLAKFINENLFQTSLFFCFLAGPLRILCFNLTVSMIMLLAAERYIAIVHPFWYSSHMNTNAIKLSAIVLMLIDIGIIVMYQYLLAIRTMRSSKTFYCDSEDIPDWFGIFSAVMLVSKIFISIVCTVNVVRIAIRTLKAQQKRNRRFIQKRLSSLKSDVKLTVSLLCVFVVLLLPTPMVSLVKKEYRHEYAGIAFHFAFLNSCLNVVVYALSKKTYKAAFTFMLTNRPCKWKQVSGVVRGFHVSNIPIQTQTPDLTINIPDVEAVLADAAKLAQLNQIDSRSVLSYGTSVTDSETITQHDVGETQDKMSKASGGCCISPELSSPELPSKEGPSKKISRSSRYTAVRKWLDSEHKSSQRADDENTMSSFYSSRPSSDGKTSDGKTSFSRTSSIRSSVTPSPNSPSVIYVD